MPTTTRTLRVLAARRVGVALLLLPCLGIDECADESAEDLADEPGDEAEGADDAEEPGDPRGMVEGHGGLVQPEGPPSAAIKAPLGAAFCQINVEGVVRATETDYVPHVIACENGGANFEALKAQAIAARSVAYYEMAKDGSICDGQGCQVYSCGAVPQQKHYDAAAATAGQYLSYNGWLTYGFYVAGDSSVPASSCVDTDNGNVSTTEHLVTFNQGKSGTGVKQTKLGTVFSPGDVGYGQNRGCMSQWGARCLENAKGWNTDAILRFYYGADIQVLQAQGSCVVPVDPPEPPPPPLKRASQSINRDYNGDGADDVFWYQPGDGADPLWLGAASGEFEHSFAPNVQSLYFTVAGDFNGDGRGDVFFYAPGALPEAVWNGTAAGSFSKSTPKNPDGGVFNVGGDYTPIAGNFNGDAYDDVLWYAPGEADDFIWYGLGGNKFQNAAVTISGTYLPVAGDFDGDGRSDILWYGGGEGPEAVWYGRASTTNPFDKLTTSNVVGWYLPFAGDFNKDGRDDIFWYAPGAAVDAVWNGTAGRSFIHNQPLRTDGTAWNVMGGFEAVPGDFDGDGATDILWYGTGANPDSVWFATSGNRFTSESVAVSGTYAPI